MPSRKSKSTPTVVLDQRWIQLENDAFVDLPSVGEGKLTRYWIYARRADGSLVDLAPMN